MEDYKEMSNKMLMDFIRDSDEKAFSMLYDRLWEPMYTKAYSLLKSHDEAKDVIQEIWISVWERREVIENNNIEGFLFNALRFKVFNQFRNSKNKLPLITEFLEVYNVHNASNSTDDLMSFNETQALLNASITKLPHKCREVFELSRFHGFKNSEIAAQMNISQRTVETHVSNALKVLKKNLTFLLFTLMTFI